MTDFIGIMGKDFGLETTPNGSKKRDILLTDQSKKTVMLTLWGADAENAKFKEISVVLVRHGVTGKTFSTTVLQCNSSYGTWISVRKRPLRWFTYNLKFS